MRTESPSHGVRREMVKKKKNIIKEGVRSK